MIHDSYKEYNLRKIVIVVDSSFKDIPYHLFEYIDKEKLYKFTIKEMTRLSKILPYPIIIKDYKIEISNDAEFQEFRNEVICISEKFDYTVPHLQKIKDYLRVNGFNKLYIDYNKIENWSGIFYK
jgi:hypothetical protein